MQTSSRSRKALAASSDLLRTVCAKPAICPSVYGTGAIGIVAECQRQASVGRGRRRISVNEFPDFSHTTNGTHSRRARAHKPLEVRAKPGAYRPAVDSTIKSFKLSPVPSETGRLNARKMSAAALRLQDERVRRLRELHKLLDPAELLPGSATADLHSVRQLCLTGTLSSAESLLDVQGFLVPGADKGKGKAVEQDGEHRSALESELQHSGAEAGPQETQQRRQHRQSPAGLRARAWKVLLEYLPPEKKDWEQALDKRRSEYYRFLQDLLPPSSAAQAGHVETGPLDHRDLLLDQLYKDLSRSRKNAFAFYSAAIPPDPTCPLTPGPSRDGAEKLDCRHNLLRRLEQINHQYAIDVSKRRGAAKAAHRRKASQATEGDSLPASSSLTLPVDLRRSGSRRTHQHHSEGSLSHGGGSGRSSPASFISAEGGQEDEFHEAPMEKMQSRAGEAAPAANGTAADGGADEREAAPEDLRWHSLLRILYIYALLNPSIGYIQVSQFARLH